MTMPHPGFHPESSEARHFQEVFAANPDQILHDFMVSHVLDLLREFSEEILFAGGTALARTYLNPHRLSEDIDLWTLPSIKHQNVKAVGSRIHEALVSGLPARVGAATFDIPLGETRRDDTPSVYFIGDTSIRIQLLDSARYPSWPTVEKEIDLRYNGFQPLRLTTLSPEGFVCAKTLAWMD